MKIVIFTQPFPMGNYLLNTRTKERYEKMGHEVLLLKQYFYVKRRYGFAEYLKLIKQFDPDICYYEMLDRLTFDIVKMLSCEKVLNFASMGFFSGLDELKQSSGILYTKLFTNSLQVFKTIKDKVESEHYKYYFSPILEKDKVVDSKYNYECVFLGQGFERTKKLLIEKEIFFDNLKNEPNFAIYGLGWDEEAYPCYKGLLPPDDIGKLYSSANSGIAIIQETQRKLGMINNRYIEMMSCGIPIYSLKYKEIDFYGADKYITFVENKHHIRELINKNEAIEKRNETKKFAEKMSEEYFNKLDHLIEI